MGYLTVLGAMAGSPNEIELQASGNEDGKLATASAGCLGCHTIGENGNAIGPELTDVGARLPRQAIARTLLNPTAPMPSYQELQKNDPEKFQDIVDFLASLK
jgi:mono/diheme cytochrome c family protein